MKLLLALITLSLATLTFASDHDKHDHDHEKHEHHDHDKHDHDKHEHHHDHDKHEHHHHHDHDDLSAHVHGVVNINMAFNDEGELIVKLGSPSINLMGFEGKASNSSEKKARKNVLKAAKTYSNLIKFKGMSCEQHDADVDEEVHGSHSDLRIEYELKCSQQNFKGVSIEGEILENYEQTETVNIQWIDASKQGKLTLDHDHHAKRIR